MERDKKKLAKKLIQRQQMLESSTERQNFEQMAEEIAQYVNPRRELFPPKHGQKQQKTGNKIYDPTAITASRTMADGMQGHLVSPRAKWFRRKTDVITADGSVLDDQGWMKKWLHDLERIEYRELSKSNFYQSMNEFIHDGVTIGTAVMYAEYDWRNGRPVFLTRHPREVYLSENDLGVVDTVFRKFRLKLRVAVDKFDLDERTQRLAEDNPEKEIEFIHAVYPRESRDVRKITNTEKAYASVYVHMEAENGPQVVRESGFDLFPYAVWRFKKAPEEVYGRSSAWDMLESIKLLNQVGKSMIKATQLAIDPPFAVPKEWKGKFRNVPGMNVPFEGDPKRIPYPVQGHGNIPITSRFVDDLRQHVNEAFRVQYFMMLEQSEREMTATEVMERQGEKATILGPAIGRLNSEALGPIMDLLYYMLDNANKLPETPPQLQEYAGADLSVDFVGPLAQAQEQYLGSQPIKNFVNSVAPYAEIFPNSLDIIDQHELARELARASGVPEDVMVDEETLQRMEQQKQQMQQAQMQMEAQQAQAEVYNKTQNAPQQGSLADKLTNPGNSMRRP